MHILITLGIRPRFKTRVIPQSRPAIDDEGFKILARSEFFKNGIEHIILDAPDSIIIHMAFLTQPRQLAFMFLCGGSELLLHFIKVNIDGINETAVRRLVGAHAAAVIGKHVMQGIDPRQ